jgi:hypothetical protein
MRPLVTPLSKRTLQHKESKPLTNLSQHHSPKVASEKRPHHRVRRSSPRNHIPEVPNGPHHPRNIPQPALFLHSSRAIAQMRLSLEVNELIAPLKTVKNLPEMKVAMNHARL